MLICITLLALSKKSISHEGRKNFVTSVPEHEHASQVTPLRDNSNTS
jgi:hypothetical protein